MKTKQNKVKFNTDIAILPMASIEKALEIETETLLAYEQEGILKPEKKENGLRYYCLDDLDKAKLARFLTQNNTMELSGVKILLSVLHKTDIKPEDYFGYIQKISKSARITTV